MSARETIAWLRICRPGCVIGQQQDWLEKIEGWLWRQGISYRYSFKNKMQLRTVIKFN